MKKYNLNTLLLFIFCSFSVAQAEVGTYTYTYDYEQYSPTVSNYIAVKDPASADLYELERTKSYIAQNYTAGENSEFLQDIFQSEAYPVESGRFEKPPTIQFQRLSDSEIIVHFRALCRKIDIKNNKCKPPQIIRHDQINFDFLEGDWGTYQRGEEVVLGLNKQFEVRQKDQLSKVVWRELIREFGFKLVIKVQKKVAEKYRNGPPTQEDSLSIAQKRALANYQIFGKSIKSDPLKFSGTTRLVGRKGHNFHLEFIQFAASAQYEVTIKKNTVQAPLVNQR